MDPIKNQISAIDPLTIDPVTEPNGEEALHKILSGSTVYSDSRPLAGVTSLEGRRRRKAQIAGGLLLGAAAVTAGVLVAANFGTVTSTPAPANTVTSAEATPTPSASVTPTPTATPSATPTASPTPTTTQAPTPTVPAAPTTAPVVPPVQVPTSQTFTFPDGHLSFTCPTGWSIRTEQGPYLSEETKAASVGATVLDSTGSEVAYVSAGFYGDGAGGWVRRTVYDQATVPGITDKAGNPLSFGFMSDVGLPYVADGGTPPAQPATENPPFYYMDVRLPAEFKNGERGSGTNQILMPNGYMSARANFDPTKQPAFASPEAAKAWMKTTQYAQLKALLLSLSYK